MIFRAEEATVLEDVEQSEGRREHRHCDDEEEILKGLPGNDAGDHDESVEYQGGASVCPQCGSTADVRTVRELLDMMNGAQQGAFQRLSEQFGFPGPASGPGQYPMPGQPPAPAPSASDGWSTAGGQSASDGWSTAGGQSASAGGVPGPGQAPGYGQFPGPGSYAQPPVQQQPAGEPWPAATQGPPGGGNQPPAQGQFPWQRGRNNDDDYDHYSVEGSNPRQRGNRSERDFDIFGHSIADEIGGAVAEAALGFVGRAVKRRMMKALEDKVMPAVQARASQAQQRFAQQKVEQDAIVARYPELRGCVKDEVIFLHGGMRTIPVSELRMPVTLAQADQVVARLR